MLRIEMSKLTDIKQDPTRIRQSHTSQSLDLTHLDRIKC
jgi:hypothetical protein